jgi:hypothetical protein
VQGATGPVGPAGPAGPAGPGEGEALEAINQLGSQLSDIQRELKIQFTRIAELQADLDQIRADLRRR